MSGRVKGRRLSELDIWSQQKDVFEQQGVDSWRKQHPVPDAGTTSPSIAYHFAQTVLAMLEDWTLQHPEESGTIYIVDLGAGVGRFAFNFLKIFPELYAASPLDLPPYQYIVTDVAASNVDFCRQHAGMQPFIEQGLLDFAVFDAETSDSLQLLVDSQVIEVGSLSTPLILIANYFFAALRRDLFRIHESSLQSVSFRRAPELVEVDDRLQLDLGKPYYQNVDSLIYSEPAWNSVLEQYITELQQTHVTFPVVGIECIQRLSRLTDAGFLLLSVDSGATDMTALEGQELPTLLVYADTCYIRVNYHALLSAFEQSGALALNTDHHSYDLTAVGLLQVDQPERFQRTPHAFRASFQMLGPNDMLEMSGFIESQLDFMDVAQIIAAVRQSRYAPRVFRLAAPRLASLLRSQQHTDAFQLLELLPLVEANNYPIGIIDNLSYSLGVIYFELGALPEARLRFERALEEGMLIEDVYFGLAITCMLQGEPYDAKNALVALLKLNPVHQEAVALKAYLETFTT